jgi:trigger factor
MLIDGCKHELAFTIPLWDVEAETDKVLADLQKKARLPGFRPGKAPVSIIRSRFEQDIRQQVLENLIPKALGQRFRDENLNVVGQPSIKDLKWEKGEAIEFRAEFEVAPEFELGDYVGVEAPYSEPAASAEEVEERLEKLRDQRAQFVNEEPRPAADGDHAVIAIRSLSGAEPPVESNEMIVEIGDRDTVPEFTENLRGVTPGETREFSVTYPENYGQERLAGQTVLFHAELKQLRRKELPALDDDFAQELGDFQTLDEVREAIRTAILREKEQEAQEKAKTAIIDRLVDSHSFAVPETFVDRQIEVQAENYLRSLQAQGVDINNIKLDWEKLKESQAERATRDVRASLILEKIADREAIGATGEDIDREVQRISRQTKEAAAVVRLKLEKNGELGRIAARVRTEKTLSFLFDKCRKVAA